MLVVTSVYDASYQDVLDFTRRHNLALLVYNKNDRLNLGEEVVTCQESNLTVIDIPNYGRCDYAFIYYIIKHYDSLPDTVLFTKANFLPQGIRLEYLLNPRHFTLGGRHAKYGVLKKEFDKTRLTNAGVPSTDIEELYNGRNTFVDPCFQSYTTNDFYTMVYGDRPMPDDYIVNLGQGPCFSATRECIKAHSIETYIKLLDTFYPGKGHWTTWEGHSEEDTYFHLGKRYHDNLGRFWMLLFAQNYRAHRIDTDLDNYVNIPA